MAGTVDHGLHNIKDTLLQEYANWICENNNNCDNNNSYKIWLDETITQDGTETLYFKMKGGKAFSMISPPLYPNHDGQFVILADPGLHLWLENLNEYLFECPNKVTLTFVLDKAVSMYDLFFNYGSVSDDGCNQILNNVDGSVVKPLNEKYNCEKEEIYIAEKKLLEDFKNWSTMNKNFFILKKNFRSDGCISLDIGTPSNKCYTLMCPVTYPTYDGSYFVTSCIDLQFWAQSFNEFLLADLQSNAPLSLVLDKAMDLYNAFNESTVHLKNDNALVNKSIAVADDDSDVIIVDDDDDESRNAVVNKKEDVSVSGIPLPEISVAKPAVINKKVEIKYNRKRASDNFMQSPSSNLKLKSEFENAINSNTKGIEIEVLHHDSSCLISFSKFCEDSKLNNDLLKLKRVYHYDFIQVEIGFDVTTSNPCLLKVIRPRLNPAGVVSLLRMDDFKFFHWTPKQSFISVLKIIKDTLQKHAEIDVDCKMNDNLIYPSGSYFDIEHDLFHLAFVSGVNYQIDFNKKIPMSPINIVKSISAWSSWFRKSEKQEDDASSSVTSNIMLPVTTSSEVLATQSKSNSKPKTISKPTYKCEKRGKYNSYCVQEPNFDETKEKYIVSTLRNIIEHLKRRRETVSVNSYSRLSREPHDYSHVFETSCLVPFLISELRGVSFFETDKHLNILQCITDVICELTEHPDLVTLFRQLPSQAESLSSIINTLESKAVVLLKQVDKLPAKDDILNSKNVGACASKKAKVTKKQTITANTSIDDIQESMAKEKSLAFNICKMNRTVMEKLQGATNVRPSTSGSRKADTMSSLSELYISQLKSLQFSECDIRVSGVGAHSFAQDFNSSPIPSSKLIMRLSKELGELSTSLPLSLQSAIFVRTDDSKLTLLRALIIGPQGTPYSGGCFVFDIYIPREYPAVPPKVMFLTTGGGKVRFNPNLYNCGRVCLSLLGTWSGPQWDKNASTLLQILVSIQSLVFVPEPYFNEPGYERSMGTESGKIASQNYNNNIFLYTVQHAMIDQIHHPSPGFEDVIRTHFRIKKDQILEELNAELRKRNSNSLKSKVVELETVL